jgi:membrane-bound lytic murein transglycosylase B
VSERASGDQGETLMIGVNDKPGDDGIKIGPRGNLGPPMAKQLALHFVMLLFAAPARAAPCAGDFNSFLAAMARDAQGQGISRGVIDSAFAGVTLDPAVLAFDRRQHGTFRQSFERYAVSPRPGSSTPKA